MIYVTDTPRHAGVTIHGDFMDFDELYQALHASIGPEEEDDRPPRYKLTRYRILGLCYELRHALMGDREIEFEDNGLTPDVMKRHAMIGNTKNVYFTCQLLWPEALFLLMLLNNVAEDNERNKFKVNYWNPAVAVIRKFQAAIASCLRELLTEPVYKRTISLMNSRFSYHGDYCTHYVDLLNVRFLKMDPEKRLKNLSIMAKRLAEKPGEYYDLQEEVKLAAKHHNCSVHDITLKETHIPDDIDW